MQKFVSAGLIGTLVIVLAGCTQVPTSGVTTSGTGETVNTSPATSLPSEDTEYTVAELRSRYNGLEGKPCYIAIRGVVYDVTESSQWSNGFHTPSGSSVKCGEDLTTVLDTQAPASHRTNNYPSQYPKVGKLVQ